MKRRDIGNLLLYLFCVIGPIVAILYSTYHAFYSSFAVIVIMMIITAGVSGVCTYYAGDAMPHVRHYCARLNLILGIIGCFNLYGHLAMSRQLSAAEENIADRRKEEDRADQRAKAAAEIDIAKTNADAALLKAQAAASEAERRRLVQLPVSRRTDKLNNAPASPAAEPTPEPVIPTLPEPAKKAAEVKPSETPEQVRAAWYWWFIIFSFVEACGAVIGGLGAKLNWAWDRNHNGIDDAEEERLRQMQQQQSHRQPPGYAPPQTATARHTSHNNSNFV